MSQFVICITDQNSCPRYPMVIDRSINLDGRLTTSVNAFSERLKNRKSQDSATTNLNIFTS